MEVFEENYDLESDEEKSLANCKYNSKTNINIKIYY